MSFFYDHNLPAYVRYPNPSLFDPNHTGHWWGSYQDAPLSSINPTAKDFAHPEIASLLTYIFDQKGTRVAVASAITFAIALHLQFSSQLFEMKQDFSHLFVLFLLLLWVTPC
jgi:hypothetical protein